MVFGIPRFDHCHVIGVRTEKRIRDRAVPTKSQNLRSVPPFTSPKSSWCARHLMDQAAKQFQGTASHLMPLILVFCIGGKFEINNRGLSA